MPLDPILLWLALCSAVVVLGRGGVLWQAKAALVILGGAALVFLVPEWAGWITGAAGLALIGAPTLLAQLVNRLIVAQRFAIAWPICVLVWLLHPERRWRAQVRTLRALSWARRGRMASALALLDQVSFHDRAPVSTALIARAHKARLDDSWDSLLADTEWARVEPALATLIQMRALAATGRVRDLVALQAADGEHLAVLRASTPAPWAFGLLALLSACGRIAALDRLLEGPMRILPTDFRAFTRAVGGLAAGGPAAARAQKDLMRLERGEDQDVAAQARHESRRARPPAELDALQQGIVEQAERTLDAYLDARKARPSPARSPVTMSLIALNLAAYALELFRGGDDDIDALLGLGALWPPAVLFEGQWWRVVTASFLHLGWLHLGMNMLALLMIGAVTERIFGWWRVLAIYAVSGLGAMLCVVGLAWLGYMDQEIVVGASGAIMGLVGALVAAAARTWWRARSRAARRRLIWLLGVIALQSALDVATPEISFVGHASGVFLGFCLGLLLGRDVRELPVPPPSLAATRGEGAGIDRRRLIVVGAGAAVAGVVAVVFPRRREDAIARRLAGVEAP